jgi:hypothetical protein
VRGVRGTHDAIAQQQVLQLEWLQQIGIVAHRAHHEFRRLDRS